MVGCFGRGPGGIDRLLELIRQHGEAIGADLLTIGRRLDEVGTATFSWWDFSARVTFAQPDSILYRALHGYSYGMEPRQLALVIELLRSSNWQRSGGRGPKPKPIRWPWSRPDGETKSIGTAAPLDEVRARLLERNGRAP